MSAATPRPFTAHAYQQYLDEKQFMGTRCLECENFFAPPRQICPRCHGDQLEWVPFSGQGRLAALTSIYIAPTAMIAQGFGRDKPYLTGIVELEEGPKISARILGFDAGQPDVAFIGSAMQVEFIEQVEGEQTVTYLAFKPAQD